VQSLGDDGLRSYCKHGYLPADQISKLDAVEAYLPVKNATVESDNESDGVGL